MLIKLYSLIILSYPGTLLYWIIFLVSF